MAAQSGFVFHPFVFAPAVRDFWRARAEDQPDPMRGFTRLIGQLLRGAGARRSDIYGTEGLTDLPGFYRPTVSWQIIVVTGGQVAAALALRFRSARALATGLEGHASDVLGDATDFWAAGKHGVFPLASSPFLGYLVLLEDCSEAHTQSPLNEPHFPAPPEFRSAPEAERYALLARRLVEEGQYTSACVLLSDPTDAIASGNYSEVGGDLRAEVFLTQLLTRVSQAASQPGRPTGTVKFEVPKQST